MSDVSSVYNSKKPSKKFVTTQIQWQNFTVKFSPPYKSKQGRSTWSVSPTHLFLKWSGLVKLNRSIPCCFSQNCLVTHPTHFFRLHRSSTLDLHFLSHNSYIKGNNWTRSAGFMDTLWVRLGITDDDLGHLGHYLGTTWGWSGHYYFGKTWQDLRTILSLRRHYIMTSSTEYNRVLHSIIE